MKGINHLTLDGDAVLYKIKQRLKDVLDDAASYFLDRFSEEIMRNGVGKTRWREDIAEALRIVEKNVLDDYMEYLAGVPDYSGNKTAHDVASVVLFGNRALDDAIYTKPGFDVYGSNMYQGTHTSTATVAKYLPEGFSMVPDVNGEEMVENAIKLSRVYFKDLLDEAAADITSEIFYGNVTVARG